MANKNTAKRQLALIKKFPFIEEIIKREIGEIFIPSKQLSISLSEAPENLLNKRGRRDAHYWGISSFRVYFAVKDGKVVRLKETLIIHQLYGNKVSYSETIGVQMTKQKIEPDYIVMLEMEGVESPKPTGIMEIYNQR